MKNDITMTDAEFLFDWYKDIDSKIDFSMIAAKTVGERIVVDFPNNPLDYKGFENWYNGQCRDYTGKHHIHSISVKRKDNEIVIFSEITWHATDNAGTEVEMYPDVTIRLDAESGKVFYYGCIDRSANEKKEIE